jgi:hypothetical protein
MMFWKDGENAGFSTINLLHADERLLTENPNDYVTVITNWKNWQKRILGVYSLGTATAELTATTSDDWHYHLELKFVKLKDGQELYTLINAGKILPDVPYDGEQSGTVVRHFRDLVREFLILCRVTLRRWELI